MADDASILREYLLALGWQVDAEGQKKLVRSLESVEEKISSVASAIESLTARAVSATRRMADSFADLYWASQKTGVSVGYIKAFSSAVAQMGGSAEGAAMSIERFAEKLRSTPQGAGYWGMLKTMGVTARDAEGALRQLGRAFSSMPYYRAKLYAEQLGIDEDTMRAMMRNVDKLTDRYLEKMRRVGLDPQSAADNAAQFRSSWRDLWDTVGVVVDKVADVLLKAFGGDFKKFNDWLLDHADEIAKIVVELVRAFIEFGTELLKWAAKMGGPEKMLRDFARSVDGLAGSVKGLVKQIRDLVDWLNKLGEESGVTWLLNSLGYYGGPNEHSGTGGPADQRKGWWQNWWEKHMPEAMGGKRNAHLRDAASRGGGRDANVRYNDPNSFYDAIIKAEGTSKYGDPYNTSLGYMKSPKPLTDMTMDEVMAWGEQVRVAQGLNSSAKGAFQIVNSTQRKAMRALGIKGSDKFSPENQRRMASWIARNQGLGAWEGFKGNRAAYETAREGLAQGRDRETNYPEPSASAPKESKQTGPAGSDETWRNRPRFKYGDKAPSSPFGGLDYDFMKRSMGGAAAPATNTWRSTSNSTVINQTNNTSVSGVSDPALAARETEKALNRTNAGLLRNFQGAAQ